MHANNGNNSKKSMNAIVIVFRKLLKIISINHYPSVIMMFPMTNATQSMCDRLREDIGKKWKCLAKKWKISKKVYT